MVPASREFCPGEGAHGWADIEVSALLGVCAGDSGCTGGEVDRKGRVLGEAFVTRTTAP